MLRLGLTNGENQMHGSADMTQVVNKVSMKATRCLHSHLRVRNLLDGSAPRVHHHSLHLTRPHMYFLPQHQSHCGEL